MNPRSNDVIRTVLSNRISILLTEVSRPAPAGIQANYINELDAYSAALVDFMRAGTASADEVALNALDFLVDNAGQLAELDTQFEKGAGKGSTMHKFIRRLRQIAETHLPEIQEAAQ